MRNPCWSRVAPRALVGGTLLVSILAAAVPAQAGPDFTRGGKVPERAQHDWNLGATGARGWMHTEKMVTTQARQILITAVAEGSPAAGVLEVGDVVLGVDGKPFGSDPRVEIGRGLGAAEARRGRLSLRRWRDGRTRDVTLRLEELGAYSATAPFDCPKSERILERGCEALAERMRAANYRPNAIPRCLNALALLASGNPEYASLVRREAQWASDYETKSFATWYYGYVAMLLAEYVLATDDRSVLPGLRRLALEAAAGQSRVGSWGHRFALPSGRLAGYGMMNAPGVPLTIGLVLAQRAGVDDPEVGEAIRRSANLLRFYAGKGAIPYGDHHPWIQTHEDNGKCGMGAMLFHLLGETEPAEFFARMALASHGAERDTGHTGNFFNVLWGMPAIALSGKQATGGWMREFGAWYFDLARRHDGSFAHLGAPQERNDSYAKWDASGAVLLALALPRRELLITGRATSELPQLDAESVEAVLADGRGWDNRERIASYQQLGDDELLQRLSSWSPIVRERAAMALGRAKGRVAPQLVAMLAADSLAARYGACQALVRIRGAGREAAPALLTCLDHEDLWLRVKAAEALAAVGGGNASAIPTLLARLAEAPASDDPRGMEQRYLCFTLFDRRSGMLRRSLDGVDREALYAAIRAGLQNEDGRARSAVSNIYAQLPFEWIEPLLPEIHAAIMKPSPSGIMFADGVRTAGLELLAEHKVAEGIEACAHYVRHMKQHGSEKRVPKILQILKGYGSHAQRVAAQLEETARFFETEEQDFPKRLSRQKAAAVRAAVAEIAQLDARPTLIRLR